MIPLHEIDEYLLFHMKKRIWDNCTEKETALIHAERLLGRVPLTREMSEADRKEAIFEIAIALADGIDPEREYRLLAKTTNGYGPVRQQRDTTMQEENTLYGIPSMDAWRIISKYIDPRTCVRLERDS